MANLADERSSVRLPHRAHAEMIGRSSKVRGFESIKKPRTIFLLISIP